MKSVPFDQKEVARGDLLCLAIDSNQRLLFKFMGHNGYVGATWLEPKSGWPNDAVLRQRDLRRLVA